MDSDNPAILYFRRGGVLYRVKAFVETVWIERQLNGDSIASRRFCVAGRTDTGEVSMQPFRTHLLTDDGYAD